MMIQTKPFAAVIASVALIALCSASRPAFCGPPVHFVPNSQSFWDFSKNWTTNYGPAYRDTVLARSNFVACTGQYALCFESGPPPLPCKLSDDGRFANCKCVVKTGLNFVLLTAILNQKVYQDTVKVCGPDGSRCGVSHTNRAPVCKAMQDGTLIPGADVISDYSPDVRGKLESALNDVPKPPLTICPKAPYAGCMTAPCEFTYSSNAECSCPIFWGIFQLVADHAECTLEDDLVYSASYDPSKDGQ
jgi:hypothetical protein